VRFLCTVIVYNRNTVNFSTIFTNDTCFHILFRRFFFFEKCKQCKLHGYTVHQITLNTFYYQLTHTTLKKVELLKHSKIDKKSSVYDCIVEDVE